MKKNYYVTLIFLCLGLTFGFGQIATNSFESSGDTWMISSFSTPPCNAGNGDQWDYSNSLSTITPSNGSQFWGIQDLDGSCGGSGFETITFSTQNVSAYTSVTISFDYFIIGFDGGDDLGYEVWEDGLLVADVDDWAGSTSGWNTLIHNVDPATTNVYLILKVRQNGGSDYAAFDNVVLDGIGGSPCVSPTNQPTGLTLSNITDSSIDGSFTATSADEYLVVASTSPTLGANPVDTTTYANGDSLGSGVVVQSSSATTFTATGLTQNTPYYFYIFSLNGSGCSGGPLYYTTNPLTDNATTLSGPCASTSFESGEPTGWSNNGSYYNGGTSNTGTQKAGMNSNNDWISTDQLSNPSDISFWARTSGTTSDYTITIQYSIDEITWFDSNLFFANGGNSGDITTTYQQFNINLNLTGNYYLRWYMSDRAGGSFYLDDVEVYCGTSTPEPEIQLVDNTTTNQNCGYTIDFGSIANDGSSADLTFDITNIGSLDLNVSSLNITGDYSIISPTTSFVVAASSSQTVTVRFTPTTTGTLTGTLTINNNDLDESACTVSLTGEGFTPTPEINVEGNIGSFPDILGDASNVPTGINNTLYASRAIGTSEAKTFRIGNEGSLNLNISNISIGGSNPGDFTITGTTPASTIIPGGIEILEITFSPLASGSRTATVIINNDDSDEDPFIFNIQGTGECISASYSLSPNEGPAGTIVTVSTLSGSNPNSTTALYAGSSTTVTNISASTFQITIPDNAINSDITFDDVTGCSRSLPFIVLDKEITSCEGIGTLPTDIFISEVTDRDSSVDGHSYLELFNGTGSDRDISDYSIAVHSNGNSSPSGYINIPDGTTLVNGDTYVISFGTGTNNVDPVSANDYFSSGTIGINDSDHLILNNGTTDIDLWGDTSGNPFTGGIGTEYNGPNPNGSDYDYRRETIGPSLTWNPSDWLLITPINYSDIGYYDFSTGVPPTITLQPADPTFGCTFSATFNIAGTEGYNGTSPSDTQELAYQWFYNAPGDSNWTEILPADSNYSGQQSATLNIIDTSNLDGYQYYCQLREDTSTCYTASNAVILNVLKSVWDGTSWSELPAIDRIVIIDGDYDTATETSFSACTLIINDNATLTIQDGTYVEVENDVIVDGVNAFINVEPEGSFVQISDSGTVTATTATNITVSKLTAPSNNWYEYTYWSSPVFQETPANFFATAHPWRRYQYNAQYYRDSYFETNNDNTLVSGAGIDDIDDNAPFDWESISSTYLIPGVGYASTHDPATFSSLPDCPGPTCRVRYTFSGLFNNGVITVPLYRNDSELGDNNWNFVGNPYPSAISADLFLAANMGLVNETVTGLNPVISGAIYLWSQNTPPADNANGNQVLNFSGSDYAIINGTGETAAQANGGDSTIPSRYIPSGQGFFIAMSDSATSTQVLPSPVSGENIQTADLIFNNSMRVTGNNNQFFRSANTSNTNKLWLNLTSDNGIFSQILVGYLDNATDLDDGMYYDAPRNAATTSISMIYTSIANSNKVFAVQGKSSSSLNLEEVIPIGFNTSIEIPTTYTISISQIEGNFMNDNPIYLIDYLQNTTHNLKDSDYNFTSSVGEFNDRFEVVFVAEALSINDNVISANDITISELQNDEVRFSTSKKITITNVEILDVLGRQIYNLKGNSSTETYNLPQLSKAAYIAKISLSNGQVISKKAIKQR